MADFDPGKPRRNEDSSENPPAYHVEVTPDDSAPPRDFVPRYVTEVIIFAIGLFIGFFWNMYAQEVDSEAHIIIALLVIIIALTRLIYYITKR